SLRWLVLIAAFAMLAVGLLFGAYKLGMFGSLLDRSLRTAQTTVSEQQDMVIPGMPLCMPGTDQSVPGGSPIASPTPGSLASVFGLAWFHKPPQDGSSAADIAADHRYIHLTGAADIPFRNQLRDAGYKGHILTYVSMTSVE